MLRYSTESISKYWDDENYRMFTFKMNSDGNLIIISSNSTNCKLYGFPEQHTGKKLYEVMATEHAARWHQRFPEWKELGLVSYIAQFEDTSVGWDTTIEVIENTLFGIGKKVTKDNLYQVPLENRELFNHFVVEQEGYILISLQADYKNNLFIIEDIQSDTTIDLSAYAGKDISEITYHCTNILDKRVYAQSLSKNKVIHFLDNLHINGESNYFDIHLYPFIKQSKLMLCGKLISSETYQQLQKKLGLRNAVYPESDQFGVCEISVQNIDDPYIIGCNSQFQQLLVENDLTFPTLVSSNVFKTCLNSRSNGNGKIALKNNWGETTYLEIAVFYKSDENIFWVTLSKEIKTVAPFKLESTQLSTRQQEIIGYVANGYTNRYIANKLNISEGTVKKTIYNSYKKLGIGSRIELVKILNLQQTE